MDKKDITAQIYNLLDETAAYIEHTTWRNKYSLALKSLNKIYSQLFQRLLRLKSTSHQKNKPIICVIS